MNESKISVRYSKALFDLALEKNILDSVGRDMLFISEVCKLPDAKELLVSPVIEPSQKNDVLHKIFEGNVEKATLSLIDLVIKNGRANFIPAIARVFVAETMKYKGITKSTLTTAVEIDAKVKQQIIDMISVTFKTKVELEENIDPAIIGGFILKIDDNYIDGSVRNKLKKIKKELIGGAMTS
ncbi:MAG: ATP synthase F1 subunit delta [Bacteroidales bacterium]|jgi:F-type H+-transporting ATPase subunit delta|nr:ATP synthase F1 subunit delta [Bacteroidales bacterium]